MGRSSSEGTRRRTRSMTKSEAAEAKMASSSEGTRRRTRSMTMKSEAAEAKTMVSSSEGGTRRRTRISKKSKPAEAKTMASSSSSEGIYRILNLESKEDRKILMKVKSEEGKLLKLKKEYKAAVEAGPDEFEFEAAAAAAQPVGKKKTKTVVVKSLVTLTKVQIDFFKAMKICPTRDLTDEQVARQMKQSKYFHGSHQNEILVRDTRFAYLDALMDQQERFGYAVDESEAEEVTDDDEGDD